MRKRFGCDAAAPKDQPAYHILCPNCAGKGCVDCEESEIRGHLPMHRCPTSLLQPGDDEVLTALKFYTRDVPVWPVQGGWADQAQPLIKILPKLSNVWHAYAARKARKESDG